VWASGEKVGLTTARDRYTLPPDDKDAKDATAKKDPPKRIDTVPGAFVRVNVDAQHYLRDRHRQPGVRALPVERRFQPEQEGARVASLDGERPVVAGFVFDESREPLKGAPFVWTNRRPRPRTLFADDVTFRTFLHGAHRLLLNAILIGRAWDRNSNATEASLVVPGCPEQHE